MQISTQRIRTASTLLVYGCAGAAVLLPLLLATYWMTADEAQLINQARLDGIHIEGPLSSWQQSIGAALSLLPVIALSVGLWHARACFRLFTDGRFFDAAAIRGLRGFAAGVIWASLLRMMAQPLLSVVLTLGNPPGQKQLVLGVSSEQLLELFIGSIVWAIAAAMVQARALAEENAQFV